MIKETLWKLGIPSSYAGHRCAVYGVGRVIQDEELLGAIMKGFCAEVGERFGKSPASVHKCLRTAIDHFWKKGDRDFWAEIVKCKVALEKPTVKEFISGLADYEKGLSDAVVN